MGHHICALLIRGRFDVEAAADLGLKPIALAQRFTMFPLDAGICARLADELNADGRVGDVPLLNVPAVHHAAQRIAPDSAFAIIETDYFGGQGDQAAAAYAAGSSELVAPRRAPRGPINEALRRLGVAADPGLDEFDTLGLSRFRNFDDLLEPEGSARVLPHWFVAVVDELPEGTLEEGILLRYGFDDTDEPGAGELQYLLLCRTTSETCVAWHRVTSALHNLGIVSIEELRLLSADVRMMIRAERNLVGRLAVDEVSLHGHFIAFKANCRRARQSALGVMSSAVTRKRWQFWR